LGQRNLCSHPKIDDVPLDQDEPLFLETDGAIRQLGRLGIDEAAPPRSNHQNAGHKGSDPVNEVTNQSPRMEMDVAVGTRR
jgi:hypothetical protein